MPVIARRVWASRGGDFVAGEGAGARAARGKYHGADS